MHAIGRVITNRSSIHGVIAQANATIQNEEENEITNRPRTSHESKYVSHPVETKNHEVVAISIAVSSASKRLPVYLHTRCIMSASTIKQPK